MLSNPSTFSKSNGQISLKPFTKFFFFFLWPHGEICPKKEKEIEKEKKRTLVTIDVLSFMNFFHLDYSFWIITYYMMKKSARYYDYQD